MLTLFPERFPPPFRGLSSNNDKNRVTLGDSSHCSMKSFPRPMVIIMLKWLNNILSKEIFTRKPKIRCHVCFLPATHNLRIISSEFDSVEESEIIITVCSGCNDEIYERYNS